MYIAVDFDGTCVEHKYPNVGQDVPHAVATMRKLVEQGHKLILWTMRHESGLEDAKMWFQNNGIPLYGVQVNPAQRAWTASPKAYAELYIDDAAFGCPLIQPDEGRPYVDWEGVLRAVAARSNR